MEWMKGGWRVDEGWMEDGWSGWRVDNDRWMEDGWRVNGVDGGWMKDG